MMNDNRALATRIDADIHHAHKQVSSLRAELAETNRCLRHMAGNVITTCVPPADTTTTSTTTVGPTTTFRSIGGPLEQQQNGHQEPIHPSDSRDSRRGGKLILPSTNADKCKLPSDVTLNVEEPFRNRDLRSPFDLDDGSSVQPFAKITDLHEEPVTIYNPDHKRALAEAISEFDCLKLSNDSDESPTADQKESSLEESIFKLNGFDPKIKAPIPFMDSENEPFGSVDDQNEPPSDQKRSNHVADDKPKLYIDDAIMDVHRTSFADDAKDATNLAVAETTALVDGKKELSGPDKAAMDADKRRVRRDRHRSLKGSDPRRSLLGEAMSHSADSMPVRTGTELARSESDGNQNSAPECDHSGSPLREDFRRSSPPVKETASKGVREKTESSFVMQMTTAWHQDLEDKEKVRRDWRVALSESYREQEFQDTNFKDQCNGGVDARHSALLRELEDVMASRDEKAHESVVLRGRLREAAQEAQQTKEALAVARADRKRLKAEKVELLSQMKSLFASLEEKERELREFIRSFQQKAADSDRTIAQMRREREALEADKWSILKRARDEAERNVALATQLNLKDARILQLTRQLAQLQEQQPSSPGSAASYRSPDHSPTYANLPASSPKKEGAVSPLSRSAEDVFQKNKVGRRSGAWGSISRVFARNKKRKPLPVYDGQRASWAVADAGGSAAAEELAAAAAEAASAPMDRWRAAHVLAWLEVSMGLPQYALACRDNIKSGKVLLELSDSELEEGLGINNPIHRRKLRLAIEEHRQPQLCRHPRISGLDVSWVCGEWLPSLGLSAYAAAFGEQSADGRVLESLTRRDLERHFKVKARLHQNSILAGIQLLRILRFDRQALERRRARCERTDADPLVWSCGRVARWAAAGAELGEWAGGLDESGVHGALAVLDNAFTADVLADIMRIPPARNILRRHLATEWNNLIQPARLSLECEGVVCKRQSSSSSSLSLASRTLDRSERKRASWRESLRSLTSKHKSPPERPHALPLSPAQGRHRRTHSDVDALTITPV